MAALLPGLQEAPLLPHLQEAVVPGLLVATLAVIYRPGDYTLCT